MKIFALTVVVELDSILLVEKYFRKLYIVSYIVGGEKVKTKHMTLLNFHILSQRGPA